MFSLSAIVTFLIVLGVLVFVHEFGHYIVARFCGVQVQTFSLGFGPKIFSRRWGPTEYCLSIIPLGGYVRLLGDDPKEEISPDERDRSFLTQSVKKKIAIVVAGPLFNLLLALLIFVGVFMTGVPSLTSDVGEVQPGSAAAEAGMKPGDRIVQIEGKPINQWEEIRETLQVNGGKALRFVVERDGQKVDLTVTPTMKETQDVLGDSHKLWLIGILPKGTHTIKQYDPLTAAMMGAKRTWDMISLNVLGIFRLIQGKISSDTIGGPILIAQMAGQQANEGILNVVLFIAILSINLGIINLFPIPILDGGHLLFFIIEGIMGKPLSLKKREIAQQVGLFLIISLMVFAFYNDIMRLFIKQG
ncbi:MAG: RIP metalloprotease RseP [Candidatus Manganitrophaceae bacterium]|nr:MAG: RIP metalloprotease RseP [Candidatus Manganitrophaceae bacterium]